MKRNILYRILVGVLALFMAMSVTSLTSFAAVWSGGISSVAPSRTSDGFYLLQTAEDLAWFANQVNSDAGNVTMKAKLMDNIYLNNVENDNYSKTWTPIADYASTGNVFSGIFDGNGFTIYGMNVDSDKDYQGLFGYLSGAQIRNVKIAKSFVTGRNFIGGIAGYSDNRSSFISCSAEVTVSGNEDVGGITGYLAMYSNISYCHFSGQVNAISFRAGGIVGRNFVESNISQSYNTGTVKSTGNYVGGIVGTQAGGMVLSCYNTGAVSGKLRVGGISGNCADEVTSCYNAASVEATDGDCGAIAGYIYSVAAKINNCYYDSSLYTGNEDDAVACTTEEMKRLSFVTQINGSAGDFYYDYLKINDSYPILSWQVDQNIWDGTMSEPEISVEGGYYNITTPRELAWFAALVNGTLPDGRCNPAANAILQNSIVLNAGNLGEGSNVWTPIGANGAEFDGEFIGSGFTVRGVYIPEGEKIGLFGQISSDAIISNVTVAESYINGTSYVGPIAGISFGRIESAKVVYTEVNGYDAVGGIVGENWNEVVKSSSIFSEIKGTQYVGGIAGMNNMGSVIEVCCSYNDVEGESYVGGIVGDNLADISNTFNVGNVTALDNYIGGIAGKSQDCSIINCYNTGDITGDSKVGGIVGQADRVEVSSVYSIGKITGGDDTNVIVGTSYKGSITDCYYDRNKVTDKYGNSVTDLDATAMRTTEMTGSDALENMPGLYESDWVATADSTYFVHYPQLRVFEESGDYDLYEISFESVSYVKDGLICKVITNSETSYFKTLKEAFEKIDTGTGVVELTDKVVINETATVLGDVTVIPTDESNIILRNGEMFDKPIVVANGATLNFGTDDDLSLTLTVDGNNVEDDFDEYFTESMITVEEGGTFNFYNTIAENHKAEVGGFLNNNGNANFYSGSVSYCEAMCGPDVELGGGVAYNTGKIKIYATHFSNNNSVNDGGVIYNAGGTVEVNTGAEFSNNTAGIGAVMYIDRGTVSMLGGSVYSNSATSYGGAFYVGNSGKLKLHDGSIYENASGISGSAVYTTGTVEFYASGCIDLSNDVFLPKGEKITMSGLSVYSSPIVKITPAEYTEGLVILTGGYTAMNANLCTVTPQGETAWQINSGGKITTSEIKPVLIAKYFTAAEEGVEYTSIDELFEDLEELEASLKEDNIQGIEKIPVNIILIDDIVLNETILIKYNTSIESDLGGVYTISAAEGFDGPLFKVINDARLTFGSSKDDDSGDVLYINGTNATGDAIIDATEGSVRIYPGTVIFGANGTESAVKSANLVEMYGGKITENNVTVGAVYIVGGTFDFFGGTIFDNKNVGVYSDGTLNIYDGAYVDESNVVYITDGNIINLIVPIDEFVTDEITGEEIPVLTELPEKIAKVDFERYRIDESIINIITKVEIAEFPEEPENPEGTETPEEPEIPVIPEVILDPERYADKFEVVDSTYLLDSMNILRSDYFIIKDNASIKTKDNEYVYGFALGVYTAESLRLQFVNKNAVVVDKNGNRKDNRELVGTGDSVVLADKNNTVYRKLDVMIYGDVNADGKVNGEDSLLAFMYIGGFLAAEEFTTAQLEAMDANHDGSVTVVDAEIIEKMGIYEGNIEQQM